MNNKIMESELEKYAKKQRQLQKQIEELFAEKKILQNKICVLNECLSLEKVKKKISQLENKQKILSSLEILIDKLKTDIKPLDYLKEVLQRQLMVSTLSTNDLNIEEQNDSTNSMVTVNSGCAIETLDSLSDVSSEDSIMILSEFDVVEDEEVCDDIKKSVTNKVQYDEALQMATSVHLKLVDPSIPNIGCLGFFPDGSDQIKDINHSIQSNSIDLKDTVTLMNSSSKSEQLLEMYDVVNKEDLSNVNTNDEIKLEHKTEKIEKTTNKIDQLCVFDEAFDVTKECNSVSKLINDSWVKVDTNESLEVSLKSESVVTELQKDSITYVQNDNNHQFKSKYTSEIESFESVSKDYCNKNEINNPVCSINNSNSDIKMKSSFLNIEDSTVLSKECNDLKINREVETQDVNKIERFENIFNDMDHRYKNESHNPVCSTNNSNDEIKIQLSLLNIQDSTILLKECNEPKVIKEVETQDANEIESFENVSDDMDHRCNEIHNPVCSINVSNDEIKIKSSSLLNTEDSSVLRECNDLSANINGTQSAVINDEKSKCSLNEFNTVDLKVELLNGIHQHGYQNLMTLQRQYLSNFINGRDIIFHSYPRVGKSTMCFISLLQRIDTSLDKCQAIVLVSTFELALSVQKMISSLGKFLNVSTFVGGFDIPHNMSIVPHVVIGTPYGIFDMINCNFLCIDFIKVLVVDDAEEMFECNGFLNQIRCILLYLNNDRQLIILSTSKLEEILDQFFDIMQNPECIILPDEKPSLDHVLQYYVNVSEDLKFDAVCKLYEVLHLTQTIVYCNTKEKSLEISETMCLNKYMVSIIHNDMHSVQRRQIRQRFRCGNFRMLVTPGLQRGENFSDVLWVINYDFPKGPKDYIRKIVGCFGRTVKVINFITKNNIEAKENIESMFNVYMKNLSEEMTVLEVFSN